MNAFRSVGARLSLALLAVVAIALGLVYLVVVPSLQNRLVDAKLKQLERSAPRLASGFRTNPIAQDFVVEASAKASSRVVLLTLLNTQPALLAISADSRQGAPVSDSTAVEGDPVALRSALGHERAHGVVHRLGQEYAEVAVTAGGTTLLLSSPLRGALEDVDLVERRLVIAGVLALAVALLLGYGAARVFARRIRRLERAAERIASGRFDEPVADDSSDELGELSRAFDRMRVQLAGLDRARREFVANASHELRTPLFSLSGFLELLEDEDLDEPTRREFLETMSGQVGRLTKLAEDLLDLSRLDAGRLHVEREDVDLADVAAVAVSEFAAVAGTTGHTLELVQNGAVRALADEQRVLQIARALLDNAIVHTPEGTTISVSTRRRDGEAALVVADSGAGIDPDEQAQVFTRFYRGSRTRASGSGLGLAIAAEVAEMMEGELVLEPSERGTTFALRFRAS